MNNFSTIYDDFMSSVNYKNWYKFLRKYIKNKGTIIDFGCGTGSISERFYKDGFDVIGVDYEKSMIDIAKQKNSNIKYVVDNMINYKNLEKVDNIICNFDTVNYLNSEKELETFFLNVKNNLKDNGFFIFDLVEEEIFSEIFENDLFVDSTDRYTCIWYHEKLSSPIKYEKKHRVSMEIFYKISNDTFKKIEQVENKTIFNTDRVIELLKKYFEIYDTAKNSEYGENRIYFILKNRK